MIKKFKELTLLSVLFSVSLVQLSANIKNIQRIETTHSKVYVSMPEDTTLYKGFLPNIEVREFPSFAWFGDKEVAKIYTSRGSLINGKVVKYHTTRPLKLIDMSAIGNIQYFDKKIEQLDLIEAEKEIYKKALNESFTIDYSQNSKTLEVKRISEPESDKIVGELICDLFNEKGYYAPALNGFHEEVFICEPNNVLTEGIEQYKQIFDRNGSPVRIRNFD